MDGAVIIADSKGNGFGFAKGVYEYIMRKQDRKFSVKLADVERTEFKDGEYKLKITHNVRRRKVFFIHDSNKDACRWLTDLVFVLEALTFSSPAEVNVVLPYTRFARQDRKDESRVSVNSKAVADIISFYADRGMTIDLHMPQIQEYFGIPFDNLKTAPILVDYLLRNHAEKLNDFVIVSPDSGGGKRVESVQKTLANRGVVVDMAICYKKRAGENNVGEIKVMGDVAGKNCLLVDDIVDTGGTLIKAGEVLKGMGARSVMAYCTHGLFSDGFEKFNGLDKMIASDSLFNSPWDGLDVVSLVEIFGEAIYRTYLGQSLSSLFD
jgi:ribose-phosphate pyrophosphokinase